MKTSENRRWWALIALVPAVLAVALDGTVLSVALPTLSRDLHASTDQLQWFVVAYSLVFAAAMIPGGMLGTPGYSEEGFAAMQRVLSLNHELVQRATKLPGLKIVFGTDAVAGAHGLNAEEFIDRVRDGGVDAMSAMVSANSLAAEAIRMSDQIGSIAPGMQADIIALDGDPLKDITAVRRVVFVMKSGIVYKESTHK